MYAGNKNEGAAWVLLLGADGVGSREAVNNDLMPTEPEAVPMLTQPSGEEVSSYELLTTDRFEVSIFPNPTEGLTFLNIATDESGKVSIEVWNVLGEQVYHQETHLDGSIVHPVNLSQQPSGQYLVKVSADGHVATKMVTLAK